MTKKELRIKYKALRSELSAEQVAQKSLAIANILLQLPIWDKAYFHLFLPVAGQNEVDTECILHLLSGRDKEIVVSKSDFKTLKMTHFLVTDNTIFRNNTYNIPEPVAGLEVPAKKIEVVFVPLLAFDRNGQRVGYGKGFYDAFLSECASGTTAIGLSFFEADEPISDLFEGDVPLNYCVTPQGIYQFKT